jgi:pimeloyl-ACP methyl ester carboxylesterase
MTIRQASLVVCRLITAWLVMSSPQALGLDWQPCALTGSDGGMVRYAECATLERPLDPSGKTPGTISLAIARLRSDSPDPRSDAVLAINGGPGGASRDMLVDLWPAFEAIAADRDVIVIDQRGTGASARMQCALPESAAVIPGPEATAEAARVCLDQLSHDARFFTTSVAVTDLEALRTALGYAQWNVYGVSYGTRVAAHYARRYPDATRSLVLDSVVPPELILGANVVIESHAALTRLDRRCQEDPTCAATFGSVLATMKRLRAEWTEPVEVVLADSIDGVSTPLQLTYGHLAAVVRLLLYAPETSAIIPLIVNEAGNGNYAPVAAQVNLLLLKLVDSLASGMHNSVVCAEDVPFFGAAEADRELLNETYLGPEMIDSLRAVCEVWPRGPVDPDLHAPLKLSTPALLLAGEFDPITPPAYARDVAAGLSRSRLLLLDEQGHSVLPRSCAPRLVMEFLDTLAPEQLRDACLSHSPRYAPFIDMAGPAP